MSESPPSSPVPPQQSPAVSQPASPPPRSSSRSSTASPPPPPIVSPLHRAGSPTQYYSHPDRVGYEERLAAALSHLHQHPHWRDVVSAVGLLHRGVDIAAESYGPNTRGAAGDVLMRLRAAIPRSRSPFLLEPRGPTLWILVAGHGLLMVCLIATIIALAVHK